MTGWSQSVPNYKDGNAQIENDRRPSDEKFYQVGATFVSPDDEHYYGLGQNQEGFLDHRGHTVECWHNYTATGAPSICVPFVVTNKGYGMVWDNPSKTTIEPGFNEQTNWISQVGNRVSFFVIAGNDFGTPSSTDFFPSFNFSCSQFFFTSSSFSTFTSP